MKLSSFGSFVVRSKGQRIGRNPKTGVEVPILPRRVMVFKPSNVLKSRINGRARRPRKRELRARGTRGRDQSAMDKSPEAFRTISEVAEDMDLPQHVLRFWETRFPQIKPLKRGGGRRYYRPDDVELLRAIKELLYGEGYTIKGVQKLLREQGVPGLARSAARERARAGDAARAAAPTEPARRARGIARRGSSRPTRLRRRPSMPRPAPAADVAALRAIQADLREAERILAQARAL